MGGERSRSWTLGDSRGQEGTGVSGGKALGFEGIHEVSGSDRVMGIPTVSNLMLTGAAPELGKTKVHEAQPRESSMDGYLHNHHTQLRRQEIRRCVFVKKCR